MTGDGGERYKKVSSAAKNMSALVDDIAKTARRNFKDKGVPEVDAKFLKDSVGALKELFEMLWKTGLPLRQEWYSLFHRSAVVFQDSYSIPYMEARIRLQNLQKKFSVNKVLFQFER